MTQDTTDRTVVRRSVSVPLDQEAAFDLFALRFADWWPLDSHHIGADPAVTAVIEPRAGGRWFERAQDGSECDWGFVKSWDPPARLLLGWQLSARFDFDPNRDLATEVEVTFEPEGDGTRVTLEHRGFEALGDDGQAIRDAVSSDGGWQSLLAMYADHAA
jgi:uncharacterized protein YndB with AHSA1/START domain